ncbi:MAG: helix-hairpin-helix domain-containing protein [Cellvibrionales bacterium]|nr:MAG: helix-hairpin-helix domain-containing protein [Cellvibrionales bacterium]
MIKQIWKIFTALALSLYMAASMAAVDVNKASAAELDAVKGIGPGTSMRIIEARKSGEFKNWQDLIDRVKGVGNKSAKRFAENGLTVGGVGVEGVPEKAAKPEKKAKDSKAKVEKAADKATDKAAAPAVEEAAPKADAKAAEEKATEKVTDKAAEKAAKKAEKDAKKAEKDAAKAAKAEEKAKAKADKAAAKDAAKGAAKDASKAAVAP